MSGERIRAIANLHVRAYTSRSSMPIDDAIEQAIRQALVEHNEECAKLAELQALNNCAATIRHLRKEFEK